MYNDAFKRNRRLRSSQTMRDLLQEHHLRRSDLIYPLFVSQEIDQAREIPSMPGIYQWPLHLVLEEVQRVVQEGIKSLILFGIPKVKDEIGSQAWDPQGVVQEAIGQIKQAFPHLLVIADTCLCEYTDHGHCGCFKGDQLDNDASIQLHAKTALAQAQAGADVIAPSNCMDGTVYAIRQALNQGGFQHIPIMAYAIKFASAFYGPFRQAAQSAPKFGNRASYQLPPMNQREGMRELLADLEEGADMVIVKPALAYTDMIYQARQASLAPIVAYNVSGEYAMVKAAAQAGWIDEKRLILESLLSLKRAGADLIISYHAKEIASLLPD